MHILERKRRVNKCKTSLHATTIYAVRHNGEAAMVGDGQVTLGEQVIMKQHAQGPQII